MLWGCFIAGVTDKQVAIKDKMDAAKFLSLVSVCKRSVFREKIHVPTGQGPRTPQNFKGMAYKQEAFSNAQPNPRLKFH